jgi:long-chain fatty acid transport protein
LLSFNANLAAAKQVTETTSVGAALTVGFGLAQLGTAGESSGVTAALGGLGLSDFGGTTSSVHDIGVGGSIGLTQKLTNAVSASLSLKSPMTYNFRDILYTSVGGNHYQSLEVEQPLEIQAGAAIHPLPNLLLEVDALWKNWSNAKAYEDVWNNQWVGMLGAQYSLGSLKLRAGYSYSSNLLRNEPSGTIGALQGLGPLPLNTAIPGLLASNDIMKIVQTTLLPVIWRNQISAGAGYEAGPHVRFDLYGNYALHADITRTTLAIGSYRTSLSAWSVGAGVAFRF